MTTVDDTKTLINNILGNYSDKELQDIAQLAPKEGSILSNLNITIKEVIEEFNKIISLVIDITNKINQLSKVISRLETQKKELKSASTKNKELDKQLTIIKSTILMAEKELNKVKDGKDSDSKTLEYVDEALNKLISKDETVPITNLDSGETGLIARKGGPLDPSDTATCKVNTIENSYICSEEAPCFEDSKSLIGNGKTSAQCWTKKTSENPSKLSTTIKPKTCIGMPKGQTRDINLTLCKEQRFPCYQKISKIGEKGTCYGLDGKSHTTAIAGGRRRTKRLKKTKKKVLKNKKYKSQRKHSQKTRR
tara:strand:- start:2745 stop:3668 length:924 start_codon:yes stop_codon:yes gene_type:complete